MPPYLPENLWGYGKRLQFLDETLQREFPGVIRRQLKILDVGCGNGSQLAIPLADGGYQVTAVDPHRPSIERGRTLSSAVNFIHGDLSQLTPCHFECIVISEVLEHLHSPETLLAQALPYLSHTGIMLITVPNGYGEFELDRRLYQALRVDKLVIGLRKLSGRGAHAQSLAGSEDASPHLQRFTIPALRAVFDRNELQLIEARGTSFLSGPFVAHLFRKFACIMRANASIADYLPLPLVAGWMFIVRRAHPRSSA